MRAHAVVIAVLVGGGGCERASRSKPAPSPTPARGEHFIQNLIVHGDLTIAGVAVAIKSPSVVLVDFDAAGQARYSVHPGCDGVRPLENQRASLTCGATFTIVDLAPAP